MSEHGEPWSFLPLSEFEVPHSTTNPVSGPWSRFWNWIRRGLNGGEEPGEQQQFDRPSRGQIEQVLPAFPWSEAGRALARYLEERPSDRPTARLTAVVGPPGSGVAETIEAAAKDGGWQILEAPEWKDLIDPGKLPDDLFASQLQEHDGLLAIPRLQRFFLRHHAGMNTLRRLLEQLAAGKRRVVLGVDSWSWNFLDLVVHLADLVDDMATRAPLNGDCLNRWFCPAKESGVPIFRAGRRHELFQSASEKNTTGEENDDKVPVLLRQIAVAARGNPAVARALWAHGFRIPPEDKNPEGREGRTYWVTRPGDQTLPQPPRPLTSMTRFVLHAILLHSGLSSEQLIFLLPFPNVDVLAEIHRLAKSEVIEQAQGRWGVTPLAYPAVRNHLQEEGYLVDSF